MPVEEPPPSPTVVLPDLPADPAPPPAPTPRSPGIPRQGGPPSSTDPTRARAEPPETTKPAPKARERLPEPEPEPEPKTGPSQEPEATSKPKRREPAPDAKGLAVLAAALRLGPAAGKDVSRYAERLAAQAAPHPVAARRAHSSPSPPAAAPDDPAGTFLPPVAARNEEARGGSTDAVPPAGLVIILAGCLVLLATLVPARAWAAAGIDHPDQARATTMLLGVGSMLVGLVVLLAS